MQRFTGTVSARYCQARPERYTMGQGQEITYNDATPNAIDAVIACY
jgi:hypothetical protein